MIAAALLCALLFTRATCTKTGLDCANTKYGFQLPVRAYPNKETVPIGDTIWLEINESTSFVNNQTGQVVDYSGAENLGSAIAFVYYDSLVKQWREGVNYFQFKVVAGKELKVTPLDIEYKFLEQQKRYVFKLAVIPKEKGLFRILMSNSNNTYRLNDRCTKASFTINFTETNQHYYLNPTDTTSGIQSGNYFFLVK